MRSMRQVPPRLKRSTRPGYGALAQGDFAKGVRDGGSRGTYELRGELLERGGL